MKRPIKELKFEDIDSHVYIDYLNKLQLVFKVDKTTKPYKLINPKINRDTLYYMKVPYGSLAYPDLFWDRYIIFKFLYVFPSDSSDLTSDKWQTLKGYEQTDYSTIFTFCLLDLKYHLNDVLSQTKLRKLYDTIVDNNYFDVIPNVNALTHWDNTIISNTNLMLDFELNKDPNRWDYFNISHETLIDWKKQVKKGANKDHDFWCD